MAETSLSGLTEQEAAEVHGQFQTSFLTFLVFALAAHLLVWVWKPWF